MIAFTVVLPGNCNIRSCEIYCIRLISNRYRKGSCRLSTERSIKKAESHGTFCTRIWNESSQILVQIIPRTIEKYFVVIYVDTLLWKFYL